MLGEEERECMCIHILVAYYYAFEEGSAVVLDIINEDILASPRFEKGPFEWTIPVSLSLCLISSC